MARERLKIPEQNVRDYAYELARQQLAAIKDIQQQCRKSGTEYLAAEKAVLIKYLNQTYKISYPQGEVTLPAGGETVPTKDKILIVDYFLGIIGISRFL